MIRCGIRIYGIVQGVGFRPFVNRLVNGLGLKGFIMNDADGVMLELEGERDTIDRFVHDAKSDAPFLAEVVRVECRELDGLRGYADFSIIRNLTHGEVKTLLPPDTSICPDCVRELFDRSNRRYRYPFINCTNCGPRFTIIKSIPYDRSNTSMADFPLCAECAAEYGDISDRRYHAEPVSCDKCGPALFFLDANGKAVSGDPIENTRKLLLSGGIVAIKGLGGMHLACLAEDDSAVDELRRRKRRDEKPFAIMCRDIDDASRLCEISSDEKRFLESPARPIVLLKKKASTLKSVSENSRLGVMLPYTPVHCLIFRGDMPPLVMTSANISELPIVSDNDDAKKSLCGIADGFLLNNRDIVAKCDDSLMFVIDGHEYFIRRSRGYVPYPVSIGRETMPILACGAEQKASFAIAKGNYVFPSQHIGDMKNIETLEHYSEAVRHFESLFDIKPEMLVRDLHPDYLSSRYADERAKIEALPVILTQHHHAHMASCMADNSLDRPSIGIVFDGSGLGDDGTIWGGEFLVGDPSGYKRRASLLPFRLAGGDKAVSDIQRIGIELARLSGEDPADIFGVRANDIANILDMNVNCPVTTSAGRLFDGAAALLGIKERVSYEGQAAILLEAEASDTDDFCEMPIVSDEGLMRIDWRPMIRKIISDRRRGVPISDIAAMFMNSLARASLEVCVRLRNETGINAVALSGGVFQNIYLLNKTKKLLISGGFDVFTHRRIPTNDEGISLGQISIAMNGGGTYVPCGAGKNN